MPTRLRTRLSILVEKKKVQACWGYLTLTFQARCPKKSMERKMGPLLGSWHPLPPWDPMCKQCKSWVWWTREYKPWALATCQRGCIFNFWLSCSLVGSSYLSSPSYKLWPVSACRMMWAVLCSNWNCRSWLWGSWLGKGQIDGILRAECSPEGFWGWPPGLLSGCSWCLSCSHVSWCSAESSV